MNAADTEVTQIQSKLAIVNKTIGTLTGDVENQAGSDAALGQQLFTKPEDDPAIQLTRAEQERDALQARLKELEPHSLILLDAKWNELDNRIESLESESPKHGSYEWKQEAAGKAREERDGVADKYGDVLAADLGAGLEAEAARLLDRVRELDKIIEPLEDRDNLPPQEEHQLEQAQKEARPLRHRIRALRRHSMTLLQARAEELTAEIAEVTRQGGGTFSSSWQYLKDELAQVDAQMNALTPPDHYDDGHGLGWNAPPSAPTDGGEEGSGRNWKVIGIAIAAVAAAVALVGALLIGGGSSNTKKVAATDTNSIATDSSSSSDSGSSSGTAAPPPNVVLASCFQLIVRPGATTFVPTFITAPMAPGAYQVTLDTAGGDKSGSATVAAGDTFAAVPVEFTQFTTINGITINGPAGAIGPGTFTSQFPFELNAANDHPTDCDGSKLTVPAQSNPAAGDVKAQIGAFLDDLAANTHAASGVDELIATLNPAVIERYGADTCRTFLSSTTDPTAKFVVVDVGSPAPFDYTSDGQTTTVPDTFAVTVQHTQKGQTTQETVHVARKADGTFSWFTRCRSN